MLVGSPADARRAWCRQGVNHLWKALLRELAHLTDARLLLPPPSREEAREERRRRRRIGADLSDRPRAFHCADQYVHQFFAQLESLDRPIKQYFTLNFVHKPFKTMPPGSVESP